MKVEPNPKLLEKYVEDKNASNSIPFETFALFVSSDFFGEYPRDEVIETIRTLHEQFHKDEDDGDEVDTA